MIHREDHTDEYVCEVCDAAFESAHARKRHIYDMGLMY